MRELRAADGRNWRVRREINWLRSGSDHEFEHDVAVGQVAGMVMMALVIVMLVAVVIWTPRGVYHPGWPILALVAVVLLVAAQWAVARPWTIVADTYEPLDTGGELWEGTVRGLRASQREVSRVARYLESHDRPVPDEEQGPLRRVIDQPRYY